MFSLDVFAEVMVVGGLLLLALVPILIRFSDDPKGKGFAPAVDYLKEGSARLIVAALVAYALGVAGNRLIDDGLDLVMDPGSEFAARYETWAAQDASRPAKLKYAEFLLRERNEATAAWLDRHKSFIRILRGAAAASALLILTMAAARLSRPATRRYGRVHFVAASLLLVIFSTAHYFEARSYKERVADLAMNLPPTND